MNFNQVFRKDVTYDNIKSYKKQGFILSLEDTFFEKPQGQIKLGWVKLTPLPSCSRVKLFPSVIDRRTFYISPAVFIFCKVNNILLFSSLLNLVTSPVGHWVGGWWVGSQWIFLKNMFSSKFHRTQNSGKHMHQCLFFIKMKGYNLQLY